MYYLIAYFFITTLKYFNFPNFRDMPIDYNLYRKFWALQDVFRKPSQCYEKKFWSLFTNVSFTTL